MRPTTSLYAVEVSPETEEQARRLETVYAATPLAAARHVLDIDLSAHGKPSEKVATVWHLTDGYTAEAVDFFRVGATAKRPKQLTKAAVAVFVVLVAACAVVAFATLQS